MTGCDTHKSLQIAGIGERKDGECIEVDSFTKGSSPLDCLDANIGWHLKLDQEWIEECLGAIRSFFHRQILQTKWLENPF